MTEYLKMVPLPSWWQKLDLNEFPISELFEDLLSWNLESKLITPKYITGTYFGAIVAIFNSIFFSMFSMCNVISNPWAGPQSRSCHLLIVYFPNRGSLEEDFDKIKWWQNNTGFSYQFSSKHDCIWSYKLSGPFILLWLRFCIYPI